MKLKIIITLFLFIFCETSQSQTYNKIIPDSAIINFIENDLLTSPKYSEEINQKNKLLSSDCISWDILKTSWSGDSTYKAEDYSLTYLFNKTNKWIDTLFNQRDKDFFITQLSSLASNTWTFHAKNAIIVNSKKTKKSFYSYSLPLFSVDGNKVVIQRKFYCGSLCADYSVRFYEMHNGTWVFVGQVNRRIS